jgi:GAF domain-containing protein
VTSDVTRGVEKRMHTMARRLGRLSAVTTELLAAETLESVSTVITDHLTTAAGATVGSFSLLDDDETLVLIGIHGGSEGVASRWATYPVAANTPVGDLIRSGRPIVLTGREEIRSRYPDLEAAEDGERSMVCLPLTVLGSTIGGVTLSFPGVREVDEAEVQFLGNLADTCAQAVIRIRAQQEARDREAKLGFLAEASEKLSSDLDYETTLTAVAEMAVPWFADWCAIALEEDGRLRTLSVAHAQPEHAALVEELQTRYPSSPDMPRGVYQVLRSGESDLVPELTDELLVTSAQDDEHLRLLRLLGFRSAMAVPLKVRDQVLGVITWVTGQDGRRYTPEDVRFGEDLARRAAVAIDNAQLHTQLRDFALQLQGTLLPQRLPEAPGWDMAVRYLPAGRTGAGGDFYDVLRLEDGRLAVFVGDVMGRGVPATSTMAQVGSALRTLVSVDPEPETVMRGLDLVFERLDLEQLVTAVYAVLDPAAGEISVINAGHPAPILLSCDGVVTALDPSNTMILGAGGGTRSVVTHPLRDGDTVLLFTDGLIERRDEDTDRSRARLLAQCRALPDTADLSGELARIVDAVRDLTRDDDVAALVLRRHREAAVPAVG